MRGSSVSFGSYHGPMNLAQFRVHLSESLFSAIGAICGSRNFDQLVKSLEFLVALMRKPRNLHLCFAITTIDPNRVFYVDKT